MFSPFLALALIPGPLADAVPFAQLVDNLSRTRKEFCTAQIEFKLERSGPLASFNRNASCTLTMLRREGTVYGKLECRPDDPFEPSETYVLRETTCRGGTSGRRR